MDGDPKIILRGERKEGTKKLEEIILLAHKITGSVPELDELHVRYDHRIDADSLEAATDILETNGKRWAMIFTGKPKEPGANFTDSEPTADQFTTFIHEYTHLITAEANRSPEIDRTVAKTLSEGVSMLVEIIQYNMSLKDKVDINDLVRHYDDIINIEANQKMILASKHPHYGEIALDKNMPHDGFRMNRSLIHILGARFVILTLGDNNIHNWKYLFDNQPTLEEMIYPEKYENRIGKVPITNPPIVKHYVPNLI